MNATITFTDREDLKKRTLGFGGMPAVETDRDKMGNTLSPLVKDGTVTSITFVRDTGDAPMIYKAELDLSKIPLGERSSRFFHMIGHFTNTVF